ncbi:unnamed protein product [Ilex paraguariensis]|uniref:Uncharacterized protein n=1 Tax=Ilex paraguariensis TaxID=185542 RepID=A0ABC8SLI1_9AQUA
MFRSEDETLVGKGGRDGIKPSTDLGLREIKRRLDLASKERGSKSFWATKKETKTKKKNSSSSAAAAGKKGSKRIIPIFPTRNECNKEERRGGCDPGRTLKTDLPPLYGCSKSNRLILNCCSKGGNQISTQGVGLVYISVWKNPRFWSPFLAAVLDSIVSGTLDSIPPNSKTVP